MHEQLARVLYYCGVHLLYASIVWLAAWAVTSIPRASATVNYWIWFATSLNFIVPAGAIVDRLFGPHLSWARPLGVIGAWGLQIAENNAAASALAAVWTVGAALMAARLYSRVRKEWSDLRGGRSDDHLKAFLAHGVPVTFGDRCQAPAVSGLLRPFISLPVGIMRLLSAPELDAVLIHEATHARRHDNLIRLIHEAGLCALWFHPFVWLTGSRLALYRELSCDESVIRSAHGEDLVSALAKLATPQEPLLLRAGASSFLTYRLARLSGEQPRCLSRAAGALGTAVFAASLIGGVWGTVSHTACCFLLRK